MNVIKHIKKVPTKSLAIALHAAPGNMSLDFEFICPVSW